MTKDNKLHYIKTRFDGGVTNDLRADGSNVASVIKHFDPRTRSHRLNPYRSYEDGDSSSSTQKIINFLVVGSTIYGLGVASGTARVKVYTKTDLSNATWTTPANGESASRTKKDEVFVYYRKTGKIYGLHGGDQAWSFKTDGSAFAETAQAIAYTNAAQGLVHSKDDIYYQPYDNKIAKNDNDSWTVAALTLPSDMIITAICEYGNYLAIGCRSQQTGGRSRVYLWDRDSSLSTLSEIIDWGAGELYVLDEIEGMLVGISSLSGDSGNLFKKVVFKYWDGGSGAKVFQELECDLTSGVLGLGRSWQKVNNTLFFVLSITQRGTQNAGVWGIGRNKVGEPLAIWLDRLTDNSSTVTPDGFIFYGDYVFISYSSLMAKTDDQANFTATSVFEDTIFNGGDSDKTKKLVRIAAMFDPLPASGQVVLKYKKDAETSFTTLFSYTTDDGISHATRIIEGAGALPTYKEITIRIESTGGAAITGLKHDSELLDLDT